MLPQTSPHRAAALLLLGGALACAPVGITTTQPAPAADVTAPANPLLQEWAGEFGGTPPFDRVTIADFKPALETAMAEELAEVERIAGDPTPPTFDNTIAALERTGRQLDRVTTAYGIWSSTLNTSEFQPIEREMAPKLAAHSDRITQNAALFRRIDAVYNSPAKSALTPEQQRLAWLYHTSFVRAGARLDDAAKSRLSAINQRLAALYTSFSQNVLADEGQTLALGSESELAGLPQSLRDGAAAAAKAKGMETGWVISNTRSSVDPFLTYSDNRELREKVWRMFVSRGDNPGEHNNNQIITEILALRAERARLLGYATHAHWRLENTMAKTPERATELLEAVWRPAIGRVAEEVRDMQALALAEGRNITIEPWDYRYYAEKVRKQRYDLDQNAVKPYLQLDRLREGMFWVAGELFGFDFAPVAVPVYHPDVRVWEVTDRTSGRHIGLWYFDPYARAGKRSGAWMNSYRRQERFDGEITTIVSNNSNFVKGQPGDPVLISWDDATTLFHEFGHALHGLSSSVSYPSLSGTAVPRDYVEFPSQLLEHWLSTPQVLERFALHHETGEPIPQSLVDRIERASKFNQGFATTEYLASAIMDMRMHLAGDRPIDAATFERETLSELGMPREIVMRHRTPHFLHVFAGDGYSAGYYSYLWSDVLTADAYQAFVEAGGLYDPAVAARLRQHIFSIGNTVDPADAYRAFRGRDPRIEALMAKRGFGTITP
ncbi:M3 family metallopeptidase [soil metagenome]